MEFDEVVKGRKSTREYSSRKALWKDVLEAVDAALQGPFAGNHNNLHFLIVENRDNIKNISDFCEQPWIADVGVLVLVLSDDRHLENIYGERGRVYSRQQAGAAIKTFLLKLTDLGLSGCWVGAYDDDDVRKKLNIPIYVQIEAIIPVGYSSKKEGSVKSKKRSLDSALFWEEWGEERKQTAVEEEREDYTPEK